MDELPSYEFQTIQCVNVDVKASYPDKLGLNLRKIHPKGNTMMRHQEVPTQKSEHFY